MYQTYGICTTYLTLFVYNLLLSIYCSFLLLCHNSNSYIYSLIMKHMVSTSYQIKNNINKLIEINTVIKIGFI